jgi:hypothetical protein
MAYSAATTHFRASVFSLARPATLAARCRPWGGSTAQRGHAYSDVYAADIFNVDAMERLFLDERRVRCYTPALLGAREAGVNPALPRNCEGTQRPMAPLGDWEGGPLGKSQARRPAERHIGICFFAGRGDSVFVRLLARGSAGVA